MFALGAVVLGHWLVIDVAFRRGQFVGTDVLQQVPWTRWLTLAFQAMPVFFLVGGYANAASWTSNRRRDRSWEAWLQRRVTDLMWPATVYVGAVTFVVGALHLSGVPGGTLARASWAVGLHLWFLSVYLVLLVLTPALLAAHRRWEMAVPVAMATAAIGVDLVVLRSPQHVLGWANYVLVWGAVHQLGVAWQQGTLTRHRMLPVAVAAAGLAAFAALVWWGPYPVSLVGVPGAVIKNTSPPSVALLAYACAQAGLLVAAEPAMSRWLERPACWARVRTANGLTITVYLWHMVPVALAALMLYPTGVMPQPPVGSAPWWMSRALWVGALALLLGLLVRALRPVLPLLRGLPANIGPPTRATALLLLVGVAALVLALARLAVGGFDPGDQVPAGTLAAYGVGFSLVLLCGGARRCGRDAAGPVGRRIGHGHRAAWPGRRNAAERGGGPAMNIVEEMPYRFRIEPEG